MIGGFCLLEGYIENAEGAVPRVGQGAKNKVMKDVPRNEKRKVQKD